MQGKVSCEPIGSAGNRPQGGLVQATGTAGGYDSQMGFKLFTRTGSSQERY